MDGVHNDSKTDDLQITKFLNLWLLLQFRSLCSLLQPEIKTIYCVFQTQFSNLNLINNNKQLRNRRNKNRILRNYHNV
jgi:hypothetical protein